VTQEDVICAVRSLLPEGNIFNNTRNPTGEEVGNVGAVTVGCSHVGCEQLVFSGCCDDRISCDDNPIAPQLAVFDAYAVGVYGVVSALCNALREVDPCTADLLLQQCARRYGLVTDDLCAPQWSDDTLRALLCIVPQIKQHVMNWEYLQELAGQFGASLTVRAAGDFSDCGPPGWWTMARDQVADPPVAVCPPPENEPMRTPWLRLEPTCFGRPDSLNVILAPTEITPPANCNLPPIVPQPHDPDLYAAFKWLLPKILPRPVLWCFYERDESACVM